MKTIKDISEQDLINISEIATGGWSTSEYSRDLKEVETGGYGLRRRVEWIQNTERYDEYHYFEISAESKDRSWYWYSGSGCELDSYGRPKYESVRPIDMARVVDYCDENNINIRNK